MDRIFWKKYNKDAVKLLHNVDNLMKSGKVKETYY